MPMPAKPTPNVVMNDGVFSFTCKKPLRNPIAPPTRIAIGTASKPMEYDVVSFSTRRLTRTALTATTPSTDKSMLPIRIMKVAPMQSTIGMAAELRSPIRLEIERKFGLKAVIKTHSASSTATGAQLRQRV